MLDRQLRIRLTPLAKRVQMMELWKRLGIGWMLAFFGAFAVYWYRKEGVEEAWEFWPLASVLGIAVGATGYAFFRFLFFRVDYFDLIGRLIDKYPEAKTLLQTAIEQRPSDKSEKLDFFQNRLLAEAISHAKEHDWKIGVETTGLLYRSSFSLWMGCGYFFFVWQILSMPDLESRLPVQQVVQTSETEPVPPEPKNLPEVDPGDVEIEAGSTLLVTATFPEQPDSTPILKLSPDSIVEQSFSMTRALEDPIFAVRLPRIEQDTKYRVEHEDGVTPDFTITTYTHPVLLTANALLEPPEYTRIPKQLLEDVRIVSIAEGGKVTLTFALNKEVATAELRTGKEPEQVFEAKPHPQESAKYVLTLTPEKNATYKLHLNDKDGRTNKLPPRFQINVLPNKPPKIQTKHPRGDVQASALQELTFQAKISDDYGLHAYGLTYQLPGKKAEEIRLHELPDAKPESVSHLLPLEELKVVPDDLVTWHFWAEDRAKDGSLRRVYADLHFAEIRPFDHIYREGIPQEGESPPGAQASAEKLAKSQKMIINATWNLLHDRAKLDSFAEDVDTILQSQEELVVQTEETVEQFDDPEIAETLGKAVEFMNQAVEQLKKAKESEDRGNLSLALSPEQSAYAQLLKTRARESQITRSQQGKGQGRSNNSEQQQQLDNLDLKEKEQRYETANQADPANDPEQREDRQALNRLRELAKRQEDLSSKIKDLNAAMEQQEETKEEEELEKQLKRLRKQQRDLLADLDELQNRLQNQENSQRTKEAQKQLQQTRQQMNEASKALQQKDLTQAQNSTTRAQEDLKELRDEYRKKVAGKFDEQMRQMKSDAKDLEEKQKQIVKHLEQEKAKSGKRLTDMPSQKPLAEQAEQQLERTENLLEQMKTVTEQAEESEPLLSRKLYESLRNRRTEQLKEDLSTSKDLLKRQFIPQAKEPLQNAANTLSGIRKDVDEAAKHVLGDPKESLRRAKKQVEDLQKQVKDEVAQKAQEQSQAQAEAQSKVQTPSETQTKAQSPSEAQSQAQASKESTEQGKPQGTPSEPKSGKPGNSQAPTNEPATSEDQAQAQVPKENPEKGNPPGNPFESKDGKPGDAKAPSSETAKSEEQGGKPTKPSTPKPGQSGNQNPQEGFGSNTGGPMTGEDYIQFSDQLRDLEEMIEYPELRNKAARIRDKARSIRKDFKRHGKEPQWDQVIGDILNPLAELHEELDEELRKLNDDQPTKTPIDRDPVPQRFSDLVQQYYDELAK